MGKDPGRAGYKKSGSRILWQITVLVLIIFIISASLSWFFYWRSTNELVDESKKKVVETQAQNMSSTFGFITGLLGEIITNQLNVSPDELSNTIRDFASMKVSRIQVEASEIMLRMIESGTMGMEEAFVVLPGGMMTPDDTILMASNQDHIYSDVPESLQPLYDSPEPYILLENGIPEWGLNNEQLAVYKEAAFGETGQNVLATGIKDMREEIGSINSFYQRKQRNVNIVMAIVIVSSLIFLFVITFFVLNHLIKSRITRPIDELSEAAEKVMEGDLDVEIEITKGEEFEGLKRAFSNMLKSLRDIMSRAAGGE
ncbi:MAG: HAMP domain-containing protein [Actinobacteria bacterium]|nr:HAMP domain-containing protein [Actinomycetota bacterium]